MTNKLIACALHDYLEIACMYGYQVRLSLKDQQVIEGKAVDLITTPNRKEYLLLDNGQFAQIELNQLKTMEALTPHAQFKRVDF